MHRECPSPACVSAVAAPRKWRALVSLLCGGSLLFLSACGPSRDEKLSEALAEARASAARAERAQKAAELALSKARNQQAPQDEPEEEEADPEFVEGDDAASNDNGDEGADSEPADDTEGNADTQDNPNGDPPAQQGRKGRVSSAA
jgi:hypothetical protein